MAVCVCSVQLAVAKTSAESDPWKPLEAAQSVAVQASAPSATTTSAVKASSPSFGSNTPERVKGRSSLHFFLSVLGSCQIFEFGKVISKTWARDSHDLFDFEAHQLCRPQYIAMCPPKPQSNPCKSASSPRG